jgi:hypothetical protein
MAMAIEAEFLVWSDEKPAGPEVECSYRSYRDATLVQTSQIAVAANAGNPGKRSSIDSPPYQRFFSSSDSLPAPSSMDSSLLFTVLGLLVATVAYFALDIMGLFSFKNHFPIEGRVCQHSRSISMTPIGSLT